ncbi:MAG: hypothetical protein LBN21_13145, partial [Treponema sp.]|nr:hypothetical protein [Treponema sp.]
MQDTDVQDSLLPTPARQQYNRYMAITLTAAADDDGRRLDRIIRKSLPDLPLSAINRLLRKGRILLDGKPAAGTGRV